MTRSLFLSALLATVSGTAVAQVPDVIVPSGTTDLMYRLVDRNGDGLYDQDGEAFDFIVGDQDNSPRTPIIVPGSPTRVYWIDFRTDAVWWAQDDNGNGYYDVSEQRRFFDVSGPAWNDAALRGLVRDVTGRWWYINEGGDLEGIWTSVDLNMDGDAEDPGETTAAVLEPNTYVLGNVPNTGLVNMNVTQLQSIAYDPTWGATGRFFCEHEGVDSLVAFEDMNGDNDFGDPGEVYLFVQMWSSGSSSVQADAHPDVVAGLLPSCNEITWSAVDTSVIPTRYYFMSRDTTATSLDAGLVFRGIDNNMDGDINDTGEVTIYWDGSLDSAGATPEYNFADTLSVWNGNVYVQAEWNGSPDNERLLRLDDNNNDGDADDPGEAVVLWNFPFDNSHYTAGFEFQGALPAPPSGLPGRHQPFGGQTCATSLPGFHGVTGGPDKWNDKAILGNLNFAINTTGSNPSSQGTLYLGLSNTSWSGVPLPLAIAPGCSVHSALGIPLSFGTDLTGEASVNFPIPQDGSLLGATVYFSSIVLDLLQPFPVTISDGLEVRLGIYHYTVLD